MTFTRLKTWFLLLWGSLLIGHAYAQPANDRVLYTFSPDYEQGGIQVSQRAFRDWRSQLEARYSSAPFSLSIHPLRSEEDAPITLKIHEADNGRVSIHMYVSHQSRPRIGPLLQTESFLCILFGFHEGDARNHTHGVYQFLIEDDFRLSYLSENEWVNLELWAGNMFARVYKQDPFASYMNQMIRRAVEDEVALPNFRSSNLIVDVNGSRRIRRLNQSPSNWPTLPLMEKKYLLDISRSLSSRKLSHHLQVSDMVWGLEHENPRMREETINFIRNHIASIQHAQPHIGDFSDLAREQLTAIIVRHYQNAVRATGIHSRSEANNFLSTIAYLGTRMGLIYVLQMGSFARPALNYAPSGPLMNAFMTMLEDALSFGPAEEHILRPNTARSLIEKILKVDVVTEENRVLLDQFTTRLTRYLNKHPLNSRERMDRLSLVHGLAEYFFHQMNTPERITRDWRYELYSLRGTVQQLYQADQLQKPLRKEFVLRIYLGSLNHPDAEIREHIQRRLRILVRALGLNPIRQTPDYLDTALNQARQAIQSIDCQ